MPISNSTNALSTKNLVAHSEEGKMGKKRYYLIKYDKGLKTGKTNEICAF